MEIRKAIKKIVALAAGTTMLGTTLLGAMAADLADYPSPFVKSGVFDGLIVVGEKAATEDVIGAIDIAASLQADAFTLKDVSCEGGITVSGGKTDEIPLGANVTRVGTTSLLDATLTDDDISGLQDTSIDLNGSNYDTHDEVRLTGDVKVLTSLSAPDDNYESNVYLEVQAAGALKYCYVWDESVNLDTHTSSTNTLSIEFLGRTLEVYDIVSATSIQAIAGTELFMDAGDTVDVDGKTVTFVKAGASSAVVDVDGVQDVISSGTTKTLNGIKVRVKDVFNEDGTEFDSAVLIVGTDALETYKNGDAYFGEDEDDPDWTWNLAGLTTEGTSQTFCVQNKKVINDLSDDPPGVGEYLSFPTGFIQIGIDSLTVADDSYNTYKVYYSSSTDLTDVNAAWTAEKTFIIESMDFSEGLKVLLTPSGTTSWTSTGPNLTADVKSDKVYLHVSSYNGNLLDVLYEDTNNKVVDAGTIVIGESNGCNASVIEVNYKDTKGTDMPIVICGLLNASADNVSLKFDVGVTNLNDGTDDLQILLGDDHSADFDALGGTLSTDEDAEVIWGDPSATTSIKIGTKNEDHRTKYGIIIRDPDDHGNNDEVELDVPGDQVKANVVVKSTGASVSSTGGTSKEINPIAVGMGVLDKDATVGDENLIVVGGPCANTIAAELLGNPDPCAEGFEQGKAKIKLFTSKTKTSLLVAGYEAMETQGACRVLADYEDYALSGDEVEVTVTSLSDISVATVG